MCGLKPCAACAAKKIGKSLFNTNQKTMKTRKTRKHHARRHTRSIGRPAGGFGKNAGGFIIPVLEVGVGMLAANAVTNTVNDSIVKGGGKKLSGLITGVIKVGLGGAMNAFIKNADAKNIGLGIAGSGVRDAVMSFIPATATKTLALLSGPQDYSLAGPSAQVYNLSAPASSNGQARANAMVV